MKTSTSNTIKASSNNANDHKSKIEALTDLFRTYASINKFREAEEVVKKVLVLDFLSNAIHREALLGPQSPLMPITPFTGTTATGSTPSIGGGGGMFGSLGQAFSQASPASASPSSSYPFPTGNNNSTPATDTLRMTGGSASLSHEDRSLIPPFYIIDPITPPPSTSDSDTYISDALVELYNKLLVFISKELGYILEITERKPSQGRLTNNFVITNEGISSSGIIDRDTGERLITNSPGSTTKDKDKDKALYHQYSQSQNPSSNSNSKLGYYEVLSNVIWTEISKRLINECGHLIFSAGRPDTFHRVSFSAMPHLFLPPNNGEAA